MFGVALRNSGCADVYWNFVFKETIQIDSAKYKEAVGSVKIEKVAVTFRSFYFELSNGIVKWFDHKGYFNFSVDQAQDTPSSEEFNVPMAYIKNV